MTTPTSRRLPPLGIFIVVFITIYTAISIGLTVLLKLPWQFSLSPIVAIGVGAPILALGFMFLFWAIKSLSLKRALGKELFRDKSESTLVTHGPYAHTRNPIYLSVLLCFLGWCLVLRLIPLAFLTVLFGIHFILVAKWEEGELKQRFGQEYIDYAKRVPLFFPRLISGKQQKTKNLS